MTKGLLLDNEAIFCLRPGMVVELPDGERCTVVVEPAWSVAVVRQDGRRIKIDASARAYLVETWIDRAAGAT